jgi:diguanylate cyclase (GGDEF)-like protein
MEFRQAETIGGYAPAPSDRTSVRRSPLNTEHPLHRELLFTRAKLADAVADRALLREKIELLESNMLRIQKFAHHDELTGLPNRRLLEDRYVLAVARSDRLRDNVALLFIDIDGFKSINDTFGHGIADSILQQLAARLLTCIRASDTACRYGGDEFVVLLSENHGRVDAVATATKIRQRLSAPFMVESQAIDLSVSIGLAMYPADGPELGGLIKAADRDMYRGKGEPPGGSNVERDRALNYAALSGNRRTKRAAAPTRQPTGRTIGSKSSSS